MLGEVENEALFSTDLVKVLVEYFWEYYYGQIFNSVFLPFMLYFSMTIIYFSVVVTEDLPSDMIFAFSWEFFLRNILLAFTLYFLWYELRQVQQNRLLYVFDPFNIIDISSATMNTLVITSYGWGLSFLNDDTARLFAAISCVLMWFKLFYWMRLFGNTSYYIRMVVDTIADVLVFLILFFSILFTFGNAMYILNYNRMPTQAEIAADPTIDNSDAYLITEHFPSPIFNIFINQYLLSLGEFETLGAYDGEDYVIVWIIFLMTTFITSITFLNMLVAIMGDSYAKVTETKDQSALVEKIKIMADYVTVVEDKEKSAEYLVICQPQDAEGGEEWEGTVSALKNAIAEAVEDMQTSFNKKLATVNQEVSNFAARMVGVKDRFDQVTTNSTKLAI